MFCREGLEIGDHGMSCNTFWRFSTDLRAPAGAQIFVQAALNDLPGANLIEAMNPVARRPAGFPSVILRRRRGCATPQP